MSESVFPGVLRDLLAGRDLDRDVAEEVTAAFLDGSVEPVRIAAFLALLAAKGETIDEITGAATAMRTRGLRVEHDRPLVLDVCGTGGDGADTINISTAVAFIVAGCGVAVAKHGNRSSSSRCGSADVLEALGVRIDESPAESRDRLQRGEVAFLFAQRYHPALAGLAGIRRSLGIRTIFNMLGPLTNPAHATHQLIGVADAALLEPIAASAQRLGIRSGAVIHATNGLDEVAGDVPTSVIRFTATTMQHEMIDPRQFGIDAPLAALRGGSVDENATALVAVLEGEASPRADVVALNAALALRIAGVVTSIDDGLVDARRAISDGRAREQLRRLQRGDRVIS